MWLLTYYGDTTSTSGSFSSQGEIIFDNAIIFVVIKIKAKSFVEVEACSLCPSKTRGALTMFPTVYSSFLFWKLPFVLIFAQFSVSKAFFYIFIYFLSVLFLNLFLLLLKVEVGIMCESCNGKGWLVCDFCGGQKTNVKAQNNRIYRRCPTCRAVSTPI